MARKAAVKKRPARRKKRAKKPMHAERLGITKKQLGALIFVAEMGEIACRYLFPDGRHQQGVELAAEALGVLCTYGIAEDLERCN
jgi:hypothetical protein